MRLQRNVRCRKTSRCDRFGRTAWKSRVLTNTDRVRAREHCRRVASLYLLPISDGLASVAAHVMGSVSLASGSSREQHSALRGHLALTIPGHMFWACLTSLVNGHTHYIFMDNLGPQGVGASALLAHFRVEQFDDLWDPRPPPEKSFGGKLASDAVVCTAHSEHSLGAERGQERHLKSCLITLRSPPSFDDR